MMFCTAKYPFPQVTGVLETLVEFAEEKMDDSSSLLQIVVTRYVRKKNERLVVPAAGCGDQVRT